MRWLRARLAACVPFLGLSPLAAGCDDQPPAPAESAKTAAPAAKSAAASAGHDDEHAPAGVWCGTKRTAEQVAMTYQGPHVDGCAQYVDGAEAKNHDSGPYADLPASARGIYYPAATRSARAKQPDACCYAWREKTPGGRPLLVGDDARTAALRPGAGWPAPGFAPRDAPPELAARLGQAWLDDALTEHASIASFARATLELMALGAPARLVAGCQAAALDEVRHTELCLAVACAYGAPCHEPGPLAAPPLRPKRPAQLAHDTFVEGCVGETIAALVLRRGAWFCRDRQLAAVLDEIAEDEARHAALAWDTLGWALGQADAADLGALDAAADALRPAPAAAAGEPALLAHGRLDAPERARVHQRAWADLIDPLLAEMLGARKAAG